MSTTEEYLKEHDLRVTQVRKKLYDYFKSTKNAISHSELELIFSSEFDRVTIYRTLNSFLDKGILHKIPNDSGSAKYAICKDDCSSDSHIDNHVHFKCTSCEQVICLHDLEIPEVKLPDNYKIKNAILLYEGRCSQCN